MIVILAGLRKDSGILLSFCVADSVVTCRSSPTFQGQRPRC
jgi:hypothetical protein